MSTLARWLDRLPLDAHARRALSEAVLDWRADVGNSHDWRERSRAHLINSIAILRVLGRVATREIVEFSGPSLTIRLIWTCLAMTVIAILPSWYAGYGSSLAQLAQRTLSVATLLVPMGAYLVALSDSPRRPRALALTAIAGVLLIPGGLQAARISPVSMALNGWLFTLGWTAILVLIADRVVLLGYRLLVAAIAFVVPALVSVVVIRLLIESHRQDAAIVAYLPGALFLSAYVMTWLCLVRISETRRAAV